MTVTRVLVVEDSSTVRARIVEVLGGDPDLEVIGEAGDGKTAIELCQRLRPDVVTLDMMLPVMTGLAATEVIMAYCPTPILVVSASTNRGELFRTYDALAAGAVDVLDKPTGDEPADEWERRLIASVKMVARIKVITHPRARLSRSTRPMTSTPSIALPSTQRTDVLAIGVSTGGPAALLDVLRGVPVAFPLPILVVIHIGHLFASAFADWLDAQIQVTVRGARDGEPLHGGGGVVMAPADHHLVVRGDRLRLTRDPERHSCRPSIDELFLSLAHHAGARTGAALLTGMGRDGAEGLLAIRQAGGRTIAQDEATSVVYGMPREAVLIGAAERVLPLPEIGPALVALGAAPGEARR